MTIWVVKSRRQKILIFWVHQVILKPEKSQRTGLGKGGLCLRTSTPPPPASYCCSCSDVQSLSYSGLHALCPPRLFSGSLADGFFPVCILLSLLCSLNSLCRNWYRLGSIGSALWHGGQHTEFVWEHFQNLCQWGRSRRRKREGGLGLWFHP